MTRKPKGEAIFMRNLFYAVFMRTPSGATGLDVLRKIFGNYCDFAAWRQLERPLFTANQAVRSSP